MTLNSEFRSKKSLGQNFMMDGNVARKLIEAADVHMDDIVLEVGPGMGILTKELLKRAKRVSAVEIDKRLVEILEAEFESEEKFEVVHGDFLKFDISEFAVETGQRIKIIGNIPYHITSQILIHAFDHFTSIESLTVTVQKEVADRIVSPPGNKDYGILSVYAALFSDARRLFNISRGVFNPKPRVESSAIKLEFREQLSFKETNIELLRNIIRKTFGKRRKMLRNSLKEIGDCINYLEDKGFDLTRRPESLDVKEFIALSSAIEIWERSEMKSASGTIIPPKRI